MGLGFAGCVVISGKNQTKYHLILGLGVVAVSDVNQTSMVATDVHSLGVMVSDRPDIKLAIGYVSSAVVTVAEGARDVRAEVSRKPWGPLVVDVPSATLQDNTPGSGQEKSNEN